MLYGHVENKSVGISSPLKRYSSSEVAAMIEGVRQYCPEMDIEKP